MNLLAAAEALQQTQQGRQHIVDGGTGDQEIFGDSLSENNENVF